MNDLIYDLTKNKVYTRQEFLSKISSYMSITELTQEVSNTLGFYNIYVTDTPKYDTDMEKLVRSEVEYNSLSKRYECFYKIEALSKDELLENLNNIKTTKLINIKQSFETAMSDSILESSLGFRVQNRRNGIHNDKENLTSLMSLNVYPILFRDADNNTRSLTKENADTLLSEMINQGLQLYQNKWQLEAEVNSCTSIPEARKITW